MGENTTDLAKERAETLAFIDELRKRGVFKFDGLGISVVLGELPNTLTVATKPDEKPVDLGGGLLVSPDTARDLFGHENQ